MASIKKQKDGSFWIRISLGRDSSGKRIYKTMTYKPKETAPTKALKEATAYAADIEARMKKGEYYDGENMTLSEYAKIWLEDVVKEHLTERVYDSYSAYLNDRILPELGHMKLAEIRPLQIQNMYKKFKNLRTGGPLAPETIAHFHTCLSSLMHCAFRQELILSNPCQRVELKKSSGNKKMQIFTPEQVRCFLNALDLDYTYTTKERHRVDGSGNICTVKSYTRKRPLRLETRCMMQLAVYAGARESELVALTWEDIDLDNRLITINKAATKPKSGQKIKITKSPAGVRTIGVSAKCIKSLRELRQKQMEYILTAGSYWTAFRGRAFGKNFVFAQEDGRMWNLQQVSQDFKRVLKLYNEQYATCGEELPMIRFHDLRHTNATSLLAEGTDIETTAKRLGHAKPSVTLNVYGHALPHKDLEAVKNLDRLFGE